MLLVCSLSVCVARSLSLCVFFYPYHLARLSVSLPGLLLREIVLLTHGECDVP